MFDYEIDDVVRVFTSGDVSIKPELNVESDMKLFKKLDPEFREMMECLSYRSEHRPPERISTTTPMDPWMLEYESNALIHEL